MVQIGERDYRCDIYYFALDPAAGRRGRKWRTVIGSLLNEWIRIAEGLRVDEERYVPFDLADQGSTWLRLEVDDDDVLSVSPVGLGPPGYSFSPSDFTAAERRVRPVLDEAAPTVRVARASFVSCIRASVEGLGLPTEVGVESDPSGAGHRHHDKVALPDGPTIWAASFPTDGYERERPPDFGLYLDARWQPPWPHAHLDWPDFGLPTDTEELVVALRELLSRARGGLMVEVGCLGGHGRTGTALACLAVLCGLSGDPVDWIRTTYCQHAVETDEQAEFVRQFNG